MQKHRGFSLRKRFGITLSFVLGALTLTGAAPAFAQPPVTQLAPPTIIFVNSTFVEATTAQITGQLNPNGKTTSCSVEFGETTAYGSSVDCSRTFSGTSTVLAQVSLQSLKASTKYHWRMVASNSDGTTSSKDMTFITHAPGAPLLATLEAKAEGPSSALANGTVAPNGSTVTSCVIQFGRDTQYGSSAPCDQTFGDTDRVAVTATLRGLSANTEYHYRVVAQNGVGTTAGADMTFRTLATPTINAAAPTAVGATTAQIVGNLNPNGKTTECSVEFGESDIYTRHVDCPRTFSGTTPVLAQVFLESLKPNTVYHWSMVATNEDGTTSTEDRAFITGPAGAPLLATLAATAISPTLAVANGTVAPNGSTVTSCVIQFGRDTQYGSSAPCDQTFEDTGRVAVTATLRGLSADTEYHYRVVAQNGIGTTAGADVTFRTPAAAVPVSGGG